MFRNKNFTLSLVLIVSQFIFVLVNRYLLDLDNMLLDNLSVQMTDDDIDNFLLSYERWGWLGFLVLPIITIVKVLLISLSLDIGAFIWDKKIKFKNILKIVLTAEFIFLIPIFFKSIWFLFFQKNFTLNTLEDYSPLSLFSLVSDLNINPLIKYPLQLVNLFEIAYIVLLAIGIGRVFKSTKTGFKVTLSGYVTSLVIWVLLIIFISI